MLCTKKVLLSCNGIDGVASHKYVMFAMQPAVFILFCKGSIQLHERGLLNAWDPAVHTMCNSKQQKRSINIHHNCQLDSEQQTWHGGSSKGEINQYQGTGV